MEDIKGFAAISETRSKKYDENLFLKYYSNVIKKDNFLSDLFFHIERQLIRACRIEQGFLCDRSGVKKKEFTFMVKNRLDQLSESKVVKRINIADCVYEIRMNEDAVKHRVLFFPYSLRTKNKQILLMTFGFSKVISGLDFTNELAVESYKTFLDFKDNNIGEETIKKVVLYE